MIIFNYFNAKLLAKYSQTPVWQPCDSCQIFDIINFQNNRTWPNSNTAGISLDSRLKYNTITHSYAKNSPFTRLDLSDTPGLRPIGLSPGSWQTSLGLGSMSPLGWRHTDGRDGVSNHQHHDCLFNSLFGRRSKKTSKFRGLCMGNVPGEFPAQIASNPENVSIWWRHHGYSAQILICIIYRDPITSWKTCYKFVYLHNLAVKHIFITLYLKLLLSCW